MYDLAIVGGGPKALAVCVRLRALETVNKLRRPIAITVLESNDWGANWSGQHGHTRNTARLATPPDRDLAFPYDDDEKLLPGLRLELLRYSWRAYLIAKGLYQDWIERDSPPPLVEEWASYLAWAGATVLLPAANPPGNRLIVDLVKGQVGERKLALTVDGAHWTIDLGAKHLEAWGLLLTGPGEARRIEPSSIHGAPKQIQCWTSESFYRRKKDVKGVKSAAVIGSGGAAAEALLHINQRWPNAEMTVYSGASSLWTRGASRFEWAAADPATWKSLSKAQKTEYLARIAQGAISSHVLRNVEAIPTDLLKYQSQRITSLVNTPNGIQVKSGAAVLDTVDIVVQCAGYDLYKQLGLLNEATRASLAKRLQINSHELQPLFNKFKVKVSKSLSVRFPAGARLYWPTAAAMKYGPSFADLTRLGHTARAIVTNLNR
jgi:mycobactin lysine-N-oxygenase